MSLLSFFGVSSPESWKSVWVSANVAYRQTRKFLAREESIAAWVRETELLARELKVENFDERRLVALIDDLRRLTRKRVDEIMEPVQQMCATAGVAVVWVPELRNTGISGCARWLSSSRALIGLTLRYKTDDQLWFTFFHELAHLLVHRHKRAFVIDNGRRGSPGPRYRSRDAATGNGGEHVRGRHVDFRRRLCPPLCKRVPLRMTRFMISRSLSRLGPGSWWDVCNMKTSWPGTKETL